MWYVQKIDPTAGRRAAARPRKSIAALWQRRAANRADLISL
jgi:hypothetical protein